MKQDKMLELITKLTEIRLEKNKLDNKEKEIIQELWDMIPSLPNDNRRRYENR